MREAGAVGERGRHGVHNVPRARVRGGQLAALTFFAWMIQVPMLMLVGRGLLSF